MAEKSVALDILLEEEVIDQTFYETLVEVANQKGTSPLTVLLTETELGQDQKKILSAIAKVRRDTFVDLTKEEFDPEALVLLKSDQAQAVPAVPVRFEEGALVIAVPMLKAKDPKLRSDFGQITRMPIRFVAAATSDIKDAISRAYRVDRELEQLSAEAVAESVLAETSATPQLADEIGEDNQVVQYVNLVLEQALNDKASDIHFNPNEHGLRVLYRIDGVLYVKSTAPTNITREIISRVKIMASLDPANRLTPQDGRLSLRIQNRKIDFRVATLPTQWGEKIVMRILDNSAAAQPLPRLGFSERNLDVFRKVAHKPHGMLLVVGPTGSGKSTTLYSALNEIVSDEINIITVEDPIEYQIENITQIEVKERQRLTFDRVLRTVLRADPDVILVGEIRDLETASIAMQAGMTGHMVFSTLHTNNAASAVTRLVNIGVEPYIVASTLTGVASQRLVRRLCMACKEAYTPDLLELDAVNFPYAKAIEETENAPEATESIEAPAAEVETPASDEASASTELELADGAEETIEPAGTGTPAAAPLVLYRRHDGGCRECSWTGFRGRLAIHEVFPMTETMEKAIVRGAQELELNELAHEEGMTSMREDGFDKVNQGLTSIEEILRVTE